MEANNNFFATGFRPLYPMTVEEQPRAPSVRNEPEGAISSSTEEIHVAPFPVEIYREIGAFLPLGSYMKLKYISTIFYKTILLGEQQTLIVYDPSIALESIGDREDLSDSALSRLIQSLPHIKEIVVHNEIFYSINASIIKSLQRLQSLRFVNFPTRSNNEYFIKTLSSLKSIVQLDFSDNQIGFDFLREAHGKCRIPSDHSTWGMAGVKLLLKNVPQLIYLDLSCNNLYCEFSDVIETLDSLVSLEYLNLSDNQIPEQWEAPSSFCKVLQKMTKLKVVDLQKNTISESSMQLIRQAIPKVEILF